MNTNPAAKRILCFGDSNTWGHIPGKDQRYPVNVRWTGVLQNLLGLDFEVIEEGLNGRTTKFEHPNIQKLGRNGKEYLIPCLESHNPLDFVVLFLGTNDLKNKYSQDAAAIANSVNDLVTAVKEYAYDQSRNVPKVIIIAPPLMDQESMEASDDLRGTMAKNKDLAKEYARVAKDTGCALIDLSGLVQSSKVDGTHLDEDSHKKIAAAVADIILNK